LNYDYEHTPPESDRFAAFLAAVWVWFNLAKEEEQTRLRAYEPAEFVLAQQKTIISEFSLNFQVFTSKLRSNISMVKYRRAGGIHEGSYRR
jgi:hypothetical protein